MISLYMNNMKQSDYNNCHPLLEAKLLSAQAVVLAVLVGATLSANLDSSSSLSKAKRLVVAVDGCGSFSAIRRAFEFGVCHVSVSRAACPRTRT